MIDPTAFIHPMACVDDSIEHIGANTKIWQFASVIRQAVIWDRCVIANGAIVDSSIVCHDVHISPGAVLFPGSYLHDEVFIGPNVVLCNDFWPGVRKTDHWGDVEWDYDKLLGGDVFSVVVETQASIGANATIMPGVRIGYKAMIAAGAVVTQDVPSECLYTRDGKVQPIRGTPKRMRTC